MDRIESVKAEFVRTKECLLTALATTPDDRLRWTPSPTARSPLHIAAHCAASIGNIHGFLDGRPFEVPTMAEADRGFREWEDGLTSREEVVALINERADDFVAWLDALTPERLATSVQTPFGMGAVPVDVAIGFPALHTLCHVSQIAYVQTIYGDLEWRF